MKESSVNRTKPYENISPPDSRCRVDDIRHCSLRSRLGGLRPTHHHHHANDAQAVEATVYSRLGSFLVPLARGISNNLTIPYDFGGTDNNGVDYVTLPAGSSNAMVIIDPIADDVAEPIETVGLRFQMPPSDLFSPSYLLTAAAPAHTEAASRLATRLAPSGFTRDSLSPFRDAVRRSRARSY